MATGVIKVRKDSGYGFILPDDGGKDLFFHVRDLARGTDESQVMEGVRVGFEVRQGDRGLMACKVHVSPAREPAVNGQRAEVPVISAAEAMDGLSQALLAAAEWVDVLRAAIQDGRQA